MVVALALIGAACADDDEDTAAATDATGSDDNGTADIAAFCDARVQLEREFNADQPNVEAVTALLEDLEASAPSDLAGNASGLAQVLATAAESGGDPTEDPAFGENIAPIDEFALGECGYETVEVTGVDYAFEGLPETIPAGTTGFRFTNDGAEPHVLVLFRYNEGETAELTDLLAFPEEELAQHLTFVGATFAEPGSAGFAELEPGHYAAICPIPVGGAEDGPPHSMEGMSAEFEVT
jgi:hypothetical protein